jgi:hypothetical protein
MGREHGDEEMTLHRSPSFSDWVTPQGSPSNSGATNEVGPLPLPVGGSEAPADAISWRGQEGALLLIASFISLSFQCLSQKCARNDVPQTLISLHWVCFRCIPRGRAGVRGFCGPNTGVERTRCFKL